jgi:hypothetical protein
MRQPLNRKQSSGKRQAPAVKLSAPPATRQDDERLLAAVRMRAIGVPAYRVTARLGLADVERQTDAVLADDLALSGESADLVRPAYWRGQP